METKKNNYQQYVYVECCSQGKYNKNEKIK